jgi:molybdopterin-containing oxidoreductase family membrane subunit
MAQQGVLGIFPHLDTTVEAIRQLRKAGFTDVTVYSPVPRHEIEDALAPKESPVRLFTLGGALLGATTGYGLASYASLDYPLVVGGKPLVHFIPYTVLGFEVAVLFGALATVLGLFLTARLPHLRIEAAYDPSFTNDRMGVFARCSADRAAAVREILTRAGATEARYA